MIGFIEVHSLKNNEPYILNISIIGEIVTNKNNTVRIFPVGYNNVSYFDVKETYDEIKQKLIMVLA